MGVAANATSCCSLQPAPPLPTRKWEPSTPSLTLRSGADAQVSSDPQQAPWTPATPPALGTCCWVLTLSLSQQGPCGQVGVTPVMTGSAAGAGCQTPA